VDATLRSFFLHCRDSAIAHIHVLYLATDNRNAHQYDTLIAAYPEVTFVPQTIFQRNVEAILDPYQRGHSQQLLYKALCMLGRIGFPPGSLFDRAWKRTFGRLQRLLVQRLIPTPPSDTYILFLVDDNLFVRDFNLGEVIQELQSHLDVLGVSLRLGRNTTYCYAMDRPQSMPVFISLTGSLLKFNWTTAEYDFGYPLEVSSSIYRAREIVPLVSGMRFLNPNDVEGYIAAHRRLFYSKFPSLLCYDLSITFCNPINIVQTTTDNRAGEQFHYTVNEMNERFDRGDRIRVNAYTGFTPNACHQEVELIFEQSPEKAV